MVAYCLIGNYGGYMLSIVMYASIYNNLMILSHFYACLSKKLHIRRCYFMLLRLLFLIQHCPRGPYTVKNGISVYAL